MRTEDGKTVGKLDTNFKRRSDVTIEDPTLRNALVQRIHARLVPEIKKSFQFSVTRIERYIVACYSAEDSGFFKAHRDNTTAGTAHRRFAVTINLNAEDHGGGELRFPEFGMRRYKAPTGGAIVFSCSLLHEALPVTKGLRYATLPFLYDDEAAVIRTQNRKFLDSGRPDGAGAANEGADSAAKAEY
jgi:predicted 2-oxoglutarate/Fe(II)-dependent dioxygenase YbiX